jgi:hypothetical protein
MGWRMNVSTGDVCRFWLGSNFMRIGTILEIDNDMVLVKWHHNVSDSWERVNRIIGGV